MRIVLVLAAFTIPLGAAAQVEPTSTMQVPRAAHTATLLGDGKVLIAGGCSVDSCELDERGATTEIFDPRTRRFESGPRLARPRVGHSATALRGGHILVAGGWDDRGQTHRAELYDPEGDRFVATGSMRTERGGFTATLLPNARVLFAGGSSNGRLLRSAEIYDLRSRRFKKTGSLQVARAAHVAVPLPGGRVLLAGGSTPRGVTATAEIYDSRTERFRLTRSMLVGRHKHAAIPLGGGAILVVGGSTGRDYFGRHATAEIYEPRAARFRRAGAMTGPRYKLPEAVVRLANGDVLVAGGSPNVEIYDSRRRRFRVEGRLGAELSFSTATRLSDGRVLIAGGYDERIDVSRRAWLFAPP